MGALKGRVLALEQSIGRSTHKTALVIVCEQLSPAQQLAVDAAKLSHRPVLILRGTMPAAYGAIVAVEEYGGSGSPRPDMTRLPRPEAWDR